MNLRKCREEIRHTKIRKKILLVKPCRCTDSESPVGNRWRPAHCCVLFWTAKIDCERARQSIKCDINMRVSDTAARCQWLMKQTDRQTCEMLIYRIDSKNSVIIISSIFRGSSKAVMHYKTVHAAQSRRYTIVRIQLYFPTAIKKYIICWTPTFDKLLHFLL